MSIYREVMRVTLPSFQSRQLANVLIPFLIHYNAVRSFGTTPLIFCSQTCPATHYQLPMLCQELRAIMFLFNKKYFAIWLPDYCPA